MRKRNCPICNPGKEPDQRVFIAEKFVRECLEIMDGSIEAGLRRIGDTKFEETIHRVVHSLPEQP